MEQKKANQERARKYGGTSSFVDAGVPSKAPRQDEEAAEDTGTGRERQTNYAEDSNKQGISNRPTKDEHAMPESDATPEQRGGDQVAPQQQGGNRGGV
ncbi:MAG: hypothetical protein AB7F99_01350 [Vicinamibacterales bacterium]